MSDPKHEGNASMLVRAWQITGGWKKNIRSVDFWLAVMVWLLCARYWIIGPWWDQVIGVMPNLLGFTLGGFAIFLGFGSDAFRGVISDDDEFKSPYISVSAAFLIFVSMQLAALLYALAARAVHFDIPQCLKSWEVWILRAELVFSGIGYFLFIYSITLAFRSAMRIFRLSRWYHAFIVGESENGGHANKSCDGDV